MAGVPGWIRAVIQNNTADEINSAEHLHRYWHGHGSSPIIIAGNRTSDFYHYADSPQGSVGAVAYQIRDGAKWIIAWKKPVGGLCKTYTRILNRGAEINWDAFLQELNAESANNKSTNRNAGFSSSLVIDSTGDTPTLTAILEPATP